MSDLNVAFLLIAVGLVFTAGWYWFFYREREFQDIWDGLTQDLGMPKSNAPFQHKYTTQTPGGARVLSVVPVPAAALANLDIGLQNMIARHTRQFPAARQFLTIPAFAFAFVNPQATNVEDDPGSPAIKVMGTQSAGSSTGLGQMPTTARPYTILPHQQATNWSHNDYLMHSAWYEAEHVQERSYSWDEFMKFTGPNDSHPHYDFADIPVIPAV